MQDIISYTLCFLQIVCFFMLPVNNLYSQTLENSESWKTYNIRILSFSAPSELVSEPFEGDDSEVWKYISPNLELVIDFGLHSEQNTENKNEDDYDEKSIYIGNRKATITFFKFKDSNPREFKYMAIAYFTEIGSKENKLSFAVYCKSPKEQKMAEKILRSIKFKDKK